MNILNKSLWLKKISIVKLHKWVLAYLPRNSQCSVIWACSMADRAHTCVNCNFWRLVLQRRNISQINLTILKTTIPIVFIVKGSHLMSSCFFNPHHKSLVSYEHNNLKQNMLQKINETWCLRYTYLFRF